MLHAGVLKAGERAILGLDMKLDPYRNVHAARMRSILSAAQKPSGKNARGGKGTGVFAGRSQGRGVTA